MRTIRWGDDDRYYFGPTVKMTDARVDYKGRLHLTTRSQDKEYTTIVCEHPVIEISSVSDVVSVSNLMADRQIKLNGIRTRLASLLFDVRDVTISNRRPKKRR